MLRWLRNTRLRPEAAAPGEAKASRAGALVALHRPGGRCGRRATYAALARAGYMKNPVVYRAVRMVAEAAASVPLAPLRRRGRARRPSAACAARRIPTRARRARTFWRRSTDICCVAGNAYVEAVAVGRRAPRAPCAAARPDERRAGCFRLAGGVRICGERAERALRAGRRRPCRRSCTSRHFHPLDDYYGFPPLEAAQTSLDVHNAASAWNKALLDNAARPSGALVYKGENGSNLSEEQFERLREELAGEFFRARRNAGRPLLLEGGLSWQSMSLSPKDMDFLAAEARRGARDRARLRRAADALGHSRRQHLRQLPRGEPRASGGRRCCRSPARIAGALGAWLGPAWGEGLRLALRSRTRWRRCRSSARRCGGG